MSFTGNMPATLFGECLLRIFLAALCGLVIGFERKARLKEAGVRTHLIVALGAALITIVSKYGFFDLALFAEGIKADPTRIAAQIVSGVGFLGAGMIFMRHRTLTGILNGCGHLDDGRHRDGGGLRALRGVSFFHGARRSYAADAAPGLPLDARARMYGLCAWRTQPARPVCGSAAGPG